MGPYILKRLGEAVLVCFGISVITFLLLHVAGDPVQLLLSIEAKAEDAAVLRKSLGLDRPLYVQYGIFLKGLLQLDFGKSLFIRESAFSLVMERFPATVQLTVAGMVIALVISVPLGVVAAIRRYSLLDNLCTALAVSGQAMPIFWLGLMLIIFFAVQLRLLPASGRGTFLHLLMPAFTLGASLAPITMRMTRSKMLDILSADYIRTARAKGLREQIVLFRHALRNASIPIVTILGLQFGRLLGGAIVTEAVFAWPGLGTLALSAIRNFDYPLAQACILTMAFIIVVVNLGVDVLVGWLDPRVRFD
ncbi:MAG: binding-protein-dependent transport system inner rane component, partial [candidate division NC10 bacterium]|jgi:peptide/nickel transport system permease protein|nr:binding-protein-dependent transport system inner rane component [candidate division NC10 bacterium]